MKKIWPDFVVGALCMGVTYMFFCFFCLILLGASSFTEAMKMGTEVYHHLKTVIKKKYGQDGKNKRWCCCKSLLA